METPARLAVRIPNGRVAPLFVLLALSCLTLALPSPAQVPPTFSKGPVNPAYLEYLEAQEAGTIQTVGEGGFGFGNMPEPLDSSHLKTEDFVAHFSCLAIPATYDLRDFGKVSPVKSQGGCGACWAFAAMGSLESSLLPAETWDFSENHLKDTFILTENCCGGGHYHKAMGYLARWSGPGKESDDPYDAGSCTSPDSVPVQKHVQHVIEIPSRSSATDNDGIKSAIMTYGAVHSSFEWSGDQNNTTTYWNTQTWAYYYNGQACCNHAVDIIGWDDNFPASSFSTPPPGDGAWLIKNSWGTGWGDSGFCWASYYDSNFGRAGKTSAAFTAEPTHNYREVYQYDPLGETDGIGDPQGAAVWGANMFTATANHNLAAASTYFNDNGTVWELYIYTGCTSGAPRSGTLAASESGTMALAGYHTIRLNETVALTGGQRFSVIFKLRTPLYDKPLSVEGPPSSAATANPGESFVSLDGIQWTDLTSPYPDTNACIKAFSEGCPTPGAPSGVTATTTRCDDVQVTWDDVPGATSYILKVGTECGEAMKTFEDVTSPYTDTTAGEGWTYQYWVQAVNACGAGVASSCATGGVPSVPASPEDILTNSSSCDGVQVSWGSVEGATQYWLYRGAECGAADANFEGVVSPFMDTSAVPGTRYQYWVRAVNPCHTGPGSSCAEGTRRSAPPAPTGVQATADRCAGVYVRWDDTDDAGHYQVLRGTTCGVVDATFETWDAMFLDTTAVPGTTYRYWVAGVNVCGQGSESACVVGRCGVPAEPAGVIASQNSCTDVLVTWDPAVGAESYTLARGTACGTLQEIFPGATTPYSDTTAVPGTAYQYWVVAVNECGLSSLSSCARGVRLVAPQPPTTVSADGTTAGNVVTWTDSAGATSYDLRRGPVCGTMLMAFPSVTSPYTDHTAEVGVMYQYWVKARNACGASPDSDCDLAMRPPCFGDMDCNGTVSIGEVQKSINMFLGIFPPDSGADCNGDSEVSIGEVQKVINMFLGLATGC